MSLTRFDDRHLICWLFLGSLSCSLNAAAAEELYSTAAGSEFPRQVYWGDTHVHSNLSLDANMSGNVTLGPDAAYRFARGETITADNCMPVRLRRPLDFLVVSDHAEYVGVMDGLRQGNGHLLVNATARRWGVALAGGDYSPFAEFARSLTLGESVLDHPEFKKTVWHRIVDAAERNHHPGLFTALIGYEWTSMPAGQNLHRVVVFRDGAERTKTLLPFSAFDSVDPEDLWAYLARYEAQTGGAALAIPHNANLRGGTMFPDREAQCWARLRSDA